MEDEIRSRVFIGVFVPKIDLHSNRFRVVVCCVRSVCPV
jgi:hypothetical protein